MIFQKLIKKIRKKLQKGFTLVEIMVTIAIIGLLAALIFVGAQSALSAGRDSRRQGELFQVKKSLQAYYLANGNQYPLATEAISLEADNDANEDFTQAMKGGGYLPIIPRDPKYGVDPTYSYKYIATTTDYYTLCSRSESKGGYLCVTGGTGIALEDDAPMFGEWGGAVFACGDTVSYDGKDYNTVEIGTQCWFSQNLNVGTMTAGSNNQGTDCPSPAEIEKYCYDNNEALCTSRGGFYQRDQATCGSSSEEVQGICPVGWHIPSDNEWYILENYLKDGGQTCDAGRIDWGCSSAATKLRTGGSSGFNAILAGWRNTNGSCYDQDYRGRFWSSTGGGETAYMRTILDGNSGVHRNGMDDVYGLSIRCIQD